MSDALLRVVYPHLVVATACAGLASANAARVSWVAGVLAAGFALCAVLAPPEGRVACLAVAVLLAGWWWGSVRLAVLDHTVLARRAGESARAIATVTAPVRRGRFDLRVPVAVHRFGRVAIAEPALLELPLGRAPPQGATLDLIAEVRRPRTADDGFDERGWLRRQGIHVVLRADRWRIVGRRGGLWGIADSLRGHVQKSLAPGVSGERRAVLAGVVLGADEGLSEDLRERFRASGLYHLLAVSGQNVALIAGGVLLFAWIAGIPRWLGELGALAAIASYLLAVGLQPSVVRAGIAGGLASLAWLLARARDRWYFLLVGATALLAWNPYNLLEPGFQLSFSAVAAIFVAVPWLERRLEGYPIPRLLSGTLAVSVACGVATAPILWLQFGAVPVYSVIANALAAPVVAPLLGMALVSAALEPVLPGAAAALGWVNQWLAAYLAACARLVGGLPLAQASTARALLALAAAAAGALVFARLRPPRARRAAVLLAMALAVVVGWRTWPEPAPAPAPAGLRVTFLDVGQGDAVLLQVAQGAVLVDQGPPEADVAAQLRRLGVRRLAAAVLTHPQRDHIGGAAEVLEEIPVGFALDPRLNSDSPDEREALAAARRNRVRVVVARAGATYQLGRLRLRLLWPPDGGLPGEDPNRNAVVMLGSFGSTDVLLTADAESEVTLPLRPPATEILKVAHHGSADPGLPALLRQVRPSVAVVSVGAGNDYGHPAPSTLAALEDAPHLRVYRTDQDGAVTVESDGARFWVREDGE